MVTLYGEVSTQQDYSTIKKARKENYKDHYFFKIQRTYWSSVQTTIDFTFT